MFEAVGALVGRNADGLRAEVAMFIALGCSELKRVDVHGFGSKALGTVFFFFKFVLA